MVRKLRKYKNINPARCLKKNAGIWLYAFSSFLKSKIDTGNVKWSHHGVFPLSWGGTYLMLGRANPYYQSALGLSTKVAKLGQDKNNS